MGIRAAQGALLLLSAIAINLPLSSPTVAQTFCAETDNLTPSRIVRTVELEQFGVEVTIPSNFRTLLRNDGSVSILAPGDFNRIQCLAKGIPVDGTDAVQMEVFQLHANPEGLGLREFRDRKLQDEKTPAKLSEARFAATPILIAEQQGQFDLTRGFYLIDGVDGVVEISSSSPDRLQSLLTRMKAIAPKVLTESEASPETLTQDEPSPEPSAQPSPEVIAQPVVSSSETSPNLIAMALNRVGFDNESRTETVVREFLNFNQAVVTVTREGIQDDSVGGLRYRISFQRVGDSDWRITDVQQSQKCQPGRGSQTYGQSTCL